MLSRRPPANRSVWRGALWGASLAVSAALAACGTTRSAAPVAATTPTAAPRTAVALQQPAAPTFPPEVTHPVHVATLAGGGKSLDCATEHAGTIWMDEPRFAPTTARDLAAKSTVVVVATATESHGYWAVDDGHLPAENPVGLNLAVLTATNFSIEHTVKGSPGAWLQLIDPGADPRTIPSCPSLARVFEGWPLPVVGQRYVLFLQHDDGRKLDRDTYGPMLDFFPVNDGIVDPPAWFKASPQPLDQFLTQLSS